MRRERIHEPIASSLRPPPYASAVDAPLRPAPVRPGAHIRVVSPAAPTLSLVPRRAERARRALTACGFTVSYGRNALEFLDERTAGTVRQRAADIMAAFADPEVDVIMAADAGIGSRDLLEELDPAVIRANPKPFVGYCDNTYLSHYLAVEAGIGSVYGCTFMQHFGEAGGPFPETVEEFEQVVAGTGPLVRRPYASRTRDWYSWFSPSLDPTVRSRPDTETWTVLRAGTGTGPLIGGEIGILADLVQNFGFDPAGAVLFWDVAFSNTEPLAGQVLRLAELCDLSALAGMVVGVSEEIRFGPWEAEVREALAPLMDRAGYPIVVNADLGHLSPSWIVPYGATVRFDTSVGLEFPDHDGLATAAASPAGVGSASASRKVSAYPAERTASTRSMNPADVPPAVKNSSSGPMDSVPSDSANIRANWAMRAVVDMTAPDVTKDSADPEVVRAGRRGRTLERFGREPDGSRHRLVCFPHAGAGAAAFLGLARSAPEDVEVVAVRLPGRESWSSRPAPRSVAEAAGLVVDDLRAEDVADFSLLGQCSGAYVAFEAARRLVVEHGLRPACVVVVSQPPVPTPGTPRGLSSDGFDEYFESLLAAGALPASLRRNTEYMELFRDCLQADLAVQESFWQLPRVPVDVPVLSLCVTGDSAGLREAQPRWRELTTAGLHSVVVEGSHLLASADPDLVIEHVMATLWAVGRTGSPRA